MNQENDNKELKSKLNPIGTLEIPEIEVFYDPIEEIELKTAHNEVENEPPQVKNDKTIKKKITKKEIVIGCCGLVLIVIGSFLLFHRKIGKQSIESYKIPQFVSLEYDGTSIDGKFKGIVFTSEGQAKVVEPCSIKSFSVLNNMFLTELESDSDHYYILTKEGYQRAIPTNCLDYIISGDGRFIYYLKYTSYDCIELYCYDIKEDTEIMLAQERWISEVVTSPDGESYTAMIKDKYGSEQTYLWVNGKKQLLGKNLHVFAISNHGTYIYYTNQTKERFCKSGDQTVQLGVIPQNSKEYNEQLFLNYSQTEVIYSNSVTGSYFMKDGKEAIKICDDMIMDYVASELDGRINYQYVLRLNSKYGTTYAVEAFENRIFRTERSYIMIQNGKEGQLIGGTSNVLTVSDDYSKVLLHNTTNFTITVKDLKNLDDKQEQTIDVPSRLNGILWLENMVYCLLPGGKVIAYDLVTGDRYNNVLENLEYWNEDVTNRCFYYCNWNHEVFYVKGTTDIHKIEGIRSLYISEYCGKYYAIDEDGIQEKKVYLLEGTKAIEVLTVD